MPAQPEGFRQRMQKILRQTVLEAAWELACANDWADVRIAELAEQVGVSRQTIYNEFGTKDQIGAALAEREIERISASITAQLAEGVSFRDSVRRTFSWIIEDASTHPLLARILRPSTTERESLLPLLTTRSHPYVRRLREDFAEAFMQRFPGGSHESALWVAEMVIRAGQSWIVLPSDMGRERYIETVVEMTVAHVRMGLSPHADIVEFESA